MRIFYWALWALMILSVMRTTILVRSRSTSEFAAVDGSAALAVMIVALLLGALMITPRTRTVLLDMRRASPMVLLVYLVIAVFSALWSVLPAFSLFRAAEVLAVYVTAFVLISRHSNFLEAEQVVLRIMMMVTLLSFVQHATRLGLSLGGLHTNLYTVTAGMSLLYCFGESFSADAPRRKILRRWSWAFLFFLIIGTSVASNISALFGLMVILMMQGFGRVIIIPTVVVLMGVMILLGSAEDLLTSTVLSGRNVEDLSNLTGRDYLWRAYFGGFFERPVLGYGFAVGARVGDLFGVRSTTNTHNGFIEAMLGMGLLGMSILFYYIYALFRELFFARAQGVPGAVGLIGAMAMMMLNNNSKSILGGGYDPIQVSLFVMLAFTHYAVYWQGRAVKQAAQSPPGAARSAPLPASRHGSEPQL